VPPLSSSLFHEFNFLYPSTYTLGHIPLCLQQHHMN
jgi:hypothetical protein